MSATEPGCILLVEDQASIAAMTADVLRGEGYRVVITTDGAAAVDYLKLSPRLGEPVRLILLDMMLPGITGIGVLRDVTRQPDPPPVTVVCYSRRKR